MTSGPKGPPGHPRPESLTGLRTLMAGNRGPFTLDGTRTHLVGDAQVAVIDPGPLEDVHIAALADELEGAREVRILLTHGHADHAGGAEALAELVGAQLSGPGPTDSAVVRDGDRFATDAGELTAVLTPGHTPDHLSYWWSRHRALFVGDLLLGEGDTTWVAGYPACVSDYLRSLDRVDELEPEVVLPAHGPPLRQPRRDVQRFRAHRLERIHQVRRALEAGFGPRARELIEPVYGALPSEMHKAAEASLAAIVTHLGGDA